MEKDKKNHKPTQNRLLAAMPLEGYERVKPHLERVSLELKHPLYEPEKPTEYVYFIEHGVGSMLTLLEDGTAVEVATIGNEGMVGIHVFLGTERTPGLGIVQIPGEATRMPVAAFKEALKSDGNFLYLLNRYTQALFLQLSQSVACNRLHPIEQRCARWLLMTRDRVETDHFQLTQEFLAQMLGTRRATVNEIARKFQDEGLITYERGKISILDRERLEGVSCECYGIIRAEYDRLLE